jgi:hypothetical protein
MLPLSDRLGALGQHHRDALLNPVGAPQARVVQQVLVGEVHEAALVDRAGEDLQQRFLQDHQCLLLRSPHLPAAAARRPS